ncbi:MAG: CoA transferase subunit A [Hyphomicrobiaceae bacterium]
MNKIVQKMADAMAGIKDGSTVLLGGFGAVGQPNHLLDALTEQGAKDLTVVANNAGTGRKGLAGLMDAGRVRKIICSFPRSAGSVVFEELHNAGKLELELVAQGTLAERIRAGGAGIPAFFTATAYGTAIGEGKEVREYNGRKYILELGIKADVALVEAWQADRWGNLRYRTSGRNFNPVMATAADLTIVQTQHIVELGELGPDDIHTPSVYVDRVIHVPYGDPPLAQPMD